jgi:UrcA family protein
VKTRVKVIIGKAAVLSSRSLLGAAAVVCTVFAGNVAARDHMVTVAIDVSSEGLDLSQPAGAQKFYARLQHAAQVACTHGNRVDLEPSPDPAGCYEKALGDAIRSANVPLLTLVYLETHTLWQAAARGIDVPVQIAAK